MTDDQAITLFFSIIGALVGGIAFFSFIGWLKDRRDQRTATHLDEEDYRELVNRRSRGW